MDNDIFDKINKDGLNKEDINLESECPSILPIKTLVYKSMLMSKPFGMIWSMDNMKDFLKVKGYKFIKRKNKLTGEDVEMAVKPDSALIPDTTLTNIVSVFEEEVQKILIKWLITIDNNSVEPLNKD